MAAALECWSSRSSTGTEEETVEQVLMRSNHRSESNQIYISDSSPSSSFMQKRFQSLSRNVSEAIASLKNTLNLDSSSSSSSSNSSSPTPTLVGSNNDPKLLPHHLLSNLRKHYDSMPISYSQAGFDFQQVFLHIRLLEQARLEDQPASFIQNLDPTTLSYKLIFASNSTISAPSLSAALETSSISFNQIHIFHSKPSTSTLGILHIHLQPNNINIDINNHHFKTRFDNALRSASRKPKLTNLNLPFGLCGSQHSNNNNGKPGSDFHVEIEDHPNSTNNIQLPLPLPTSSFLLSVDEWQTVRSGADHIGKWLFNSDTLEFTDQVGPTSFKGFFKGKKVAIEKLKGCDKGNAYDFELRQDLLQLMTCAHNNVVPFYGVCVDDIHGLCVVTRFMEGGSVYDLMLKNKKLQIKDVIRIAVDVAEGVKFLNDHGVAYRDLNTQRILLDRQGNAYLGDMGIVTACKTMVEVMDYETDGYRWLAPEIIAADPESVSETWMSNVYSYGMVIWEMVTGEAAYSAYSPVQAAVGIAACGLRPEIPKDCPQVLKSIMLKCWNNCPSKRPQFSEILSVLLRPNSISK